MTLAIRVLVLLTVSFAVCGMPAMGYGSNNDPYVEHWLAVLKKGDSLEKRLALDRLYLKYYDIKESALLDHIYGALRDGDVEVRLAAVACLERFGASHEEFYRDTRYSKDYFKKKLESKDNSSREFARSSLREYDARDSIVPRLVDTLSDRDPKVRAEAAIALLYYKDESAVDALVKGLDDADPWVRLNAVYALGRLRARKSIDSLVTVFLDGSDWRNEYVQQEAALALSGMGVTLNTDQRKRRAEYMKSGPRLPKPGPGFSGYDPGMDRYVTPEAQEQAKMDELLAGKIISGFIKKSADPYLKRVLLKIFGTHGIREARDIVVKAASDPDEMIRKTAIESLARLDRAPPRDASRGIMPSPLLKERRP